MGTEGEFISAKELEGGGYFAAIDMMAVIRKFKGAIFIDITQGVRFPFCRPERSEGSVIY